MSEESLREVNHIPARMLIKAGSTLLVPRGNALLADVSSTVADTATLALAPEAPPLRKTSLKAGKKDSVASVAKRYHVAPAQVAEWNHVAPGASFTPGQTVVVYTAATTPRKATAASAGTQTARSKTVPGGPRSSGATVATSGNGASGSSAKTARAGKATSVRQTPVARH
jgi:membrane-bound lytic murein transglycosylase D